VGKRWTKGRAGQQTSKKRKSGGAPGGGDASRASGTLGGIRGFTKGFFSGGKQKPKTTTGKIIDWALWVAVVAVGYVVLQSRCH
jgi:hypothetical protein